MFIFALVPVALTSVVVFFFPSAALLLGLCYLLVSVVIAFAAYSSIQQTTNCVTHKLAHTGAQLKTGLMIAADLIFAIVCILRGCVLASIFPIAGIVASFAPTLLNSMTDRYVRDSRTVTKGGLKVASASAVAAGTAVGTAVAGPAGMAVGASIGGAMESVTNDAANNMTDVEAHIDTNAIKQQTIQAVKAAPVESIEDVRARMDAQAASYAKNHGIEQKYIDAEVKELPNNSNLTEDEKHFFETHSVTQGDLDRINHAVDVGNKYGVEMDANDISEVWQRGHENTGTSQALRLQDQVAGKGAYL